MLQKLRDQTQSAGFKVIVAVLVFALAFFGFGAFNIFAPGDPTVANVNGDEITQSALLGEVERERRRLLAGLGDELDMDALDPLAMQGAALEGLIARTLLGQMADAFGLAASPAQVDAVILADPGFQIDGAFNADLYRRGLSAMGFTPTGYQAELATRIRNDQLRNAIQGSAFAASWERSAFIRLLGQQRDLAWLPFAAAQFSADVQLDEAEVELYYQEHEAEMLSEESVSASYVELSWTLLLDDPSIDISDNDLRREYEADKAAAADEEQRSSAHILLRTGDERSDDQAIAELQELKTRIEQGESFAELAEAHSEDPGSASAGGALGSVGRGVFDPAFEAALWALQEEGELSAPVQSAFGYHLIRLDGVSKADFPSFAEQSDGLRQRLREAAARDLFADRVRELDNLAFEQNDSLDGIAEALGLEAQTAANITRGMGPGPFVEQSLRDALFAPDVLEDGYNTAAVEFGDARAVVARVSEHRPPALRPFAEVRGEIQALLVERAAQEALQEAHAAALARLQAGESVSAVARDYGLIWENVERARRTDPGVPGAVREAAFALPRPAAGGKSLGVAELEEGGRAIVTVTRVVEGDSATLSDAEVDALSNLLLDFRRQLDFEAIYQSYRASADISRPESQLE